LLPLGDVAVETQSEVAKSVEPRKRGRRPGTLAKITEHMNRRKRRNHLGPEAEETIRAELEGGMGLSEACKKYDISVSTYYRLKNESNSKPVVED